MGNVIRPLGLLFMSGKNWLGAPNNNNNRIVPTYEERSKYVCT